MFPYECLSRLGTPSITVGADGSLLFENRAFREKRHLLGLSLPGILKNACLGVGDEKPRFDVLTGKRQDIPLLILPHGEETVCLWLRSASRALLLLSREDRRMAAETFADVFWSLTKNGEENLGAVVGHRLPMTEHPCFASHLQALASLTFRLLFGEPLLEAANEVDRLVVEEPFTALQAVILCGRCLLEAHGKGLPLSVTLSLQEDEMILTAMEERFSAGRCRAPSLAETPAPFFFRSDNAVPAFVLAASAEAIVTA
ncbi:MAG: hypothetical protein IJD10_07700 [Clostridia bacterium]|nr:hypothetical protein [Clostridia bacterium]